MQFTIYQEQLFSSLQLVNDAVDKKHAIPILTHIYIQAGEQITLTATDLEIQIKAVIDTQADEPGAVCVPAEKFCNIIQSLPKDARIKISSKDEKTTITSGRSRFVLNGLPSNSYPDFLCKTENQIYLPIAAFKKALEKTQFSMGKNDVRYYLNGLLIYIADKEFKTVGSDGHRLAFFKTDIDSDINAKIILPKKIIEILLRRVETDDSLIKLEFSSTHFIATYANFEFSSKLIDSNYPDFSKIYEQAFYPDLQLDTVNVKNALQRALILSDQKLKGLNLSLTQSEFTIRSHNAESDEAEEPLEIEGPETDIQIAFNGTYLIDALSHIDSIKFNLKLAQNLSTCFIQDALDDSYQFVVMPMRL